MTTNTKRLQQITVLKSGGHEPDSTFCLMEAVAYVAGEPWSDAPACACPVLSAYGRALNDNMDDTDRQLLIPFIPRLVGSKSTPEVEQRRGYLMADTAVRVFAPIALRSAGLDIEAAKLEALLVIDSPDSAARAVYAAAHAAHAARAAAHAAARAAADAVYAVYAADAVYAAAHAVYAADAAGWKPALKLFSQALGIIDNVRPDPYGVFIKKEE